MATLQKDRIIREQLSDFSTLVPDDELSPVLRFIFMYGTGGLGNAKIKEESFGQQDSTLYPVK